MPLPLGARQPATGIMRGMPPSGASTYFQVFDVLADVSLEDSWVLDVQATDHDCTFRLDLCASLQVTRCPFSRDRADPLSMPAVNWTGGTSTASSLWTGKAETPGC